MGKTPQMANLGSRHDDEDGASEVNSVEYSFHNENNTPLGGGGKPKEDDAGAALRLMLREVKKNTARGDDTSSTKEKQELMEGLAEFEKEIVERIKTRDERSRGESVPAEIATSPQGSIGSEASTFDTARENETAGGPGDASLVSQSQEPKGRYPKRDREASKKHPFNL